MTPDLQTPREPRSRAIFRYTEASFRATGLTRQAFACKVADDYQARVAANDRIVEFHVGTTIDAIEKAHKANDQLIKRFLERKVKLPADLEESWIAALPQPHRADCERELAQRYGFLGARAVTNAQAARTLSTGQSTVEFGHVLQEIGAVMADNEITPADRPRLLAARKELHDLLAELATLGATLDQAIEDVSAAPSLRAVG